MFLSKLFHRNKQDEAYEDAMYEQQAYASLETENIVKELHLSKKTQTKNYVVDLCEQMVSTSQDFEETKEEYRLVTNYLTDIQVIEDLTEAEKRPIVECATHVAELNRQRTAFLEKKHLISDEMFAQMQEEDTALPGIIRRLKANEDYLNAVKKDMAFLEGKKLEWSMQKSDAKRLQKVMQRVVIVMIALFVTMLILFFVLSSYTRMDVGLGITIMGFIAAVAATYIVVRYQDAAREIRQADVNRNHAITLENRAKIKYVNNKNAVDFTCEKYHVRNVKELQSLYENYQEEARQREEFRKTSEELDTYSRSLVQYLTRLRMYDPRMWINHADAIMDSKALVELKHEQIARRQKLRDRMESTMNSLFDMKQEALKNIDSFGNEREKVEGIIHKIESLNPNL